MELSKGLRSLLITFINESVTVVSWGITEIHIFSNRLTFKVDGFLYKGEIEIIECNSVFTVKLSDSEFLCQLNDIVDFLDSKIEKTDSYTSDLIDWIMQQ